jgi:hypothetical protein
MRSKTYYLVVNAVTQTPVSAHSTEWAAKMACDFETTERNKYVVVEVEGVVVPIPKEKAPEVSSEGGKWSEFDPGSDGGKYKG